MYTNKSIPLNVCKSVTNKILWVDERVCLPLTCGTSHSTSADLMVLFSFIQQQQPERMRWICLIRTSKSEHFPAFWGRVWEKSRRASWQSVAMPPLDMNTHVWLILPALRVHHLKEMIYLSKSSLLFDPMGSWSRSGGDARLPKCVFAILPLPFHPFLLLCLDRPFYNLRLS